MSKKNLFITITSVVAGVLAVAGTAFAIFKKKKTKAISSENEKETEVEAEVEESAPTTVDVTDD